MNTFVPYLNCKFVKRYGPQIIFTGIFSLLIIGAVVGSLFIPYIGLSASGLPEIDGNPLKGINCLMYTMNYFVARDTSYATSVYQTVIVAFFRNAGVTGIPLQLVAHAPFITSICLALEFIFCIVLLIVGLKCIIYGKLHNFRLASTMSGFVLAFAIISGFAPLIPFVVGKIFIKNVEYSLTFWWMTFAIAGGILVFRIVLSFLYDYGLYGHIFVKDKFQLASIKESVAPQSQTMINPTPSRAIQPDIEVDRIINGNERPIHISQKRDVCLPEKIISIGGHAYANNSVLTIATIPHGIPSLGVGAFANCINLKTVVIPTSVKQISANCFFNCIALSRVCYEGTKKEWSRITRGSNWLTKAGTQIVVCSDGAIIVNPYH